MKDIIKRASKTLLILFAWLVIFDVGSQILLKILDNEKLSDFFSYGFSTEIQIRNMFKKDIPSNSVLHAGWIDKEKFRERGIEADITVYGMSFSNHIADQLMITDSDLIVRKIDGPASPINHSLSSFLVDKDVCQSRVVALGILDSSLKYINAMTNDTIGGDRPMGSFYPQFIFSSDGYEQIYPKINSFEELQTALSESFLWEENLELLRKYDKSYSPFIYKKNLFDYSIIGRFIKRWYKSRHNKNVTEQVFKNGKFNEETLAQAEALISLFVEEAQASEYIPIVILIETQLYGDALGKTMVPFLDELGVDYLNTGDIVLTTNPANFMSDGHITAENNEKIAIELDRLVKSILPQ